MKSTDKKYSLWSAIVIAIILSVITLRYPQENIFAYDNYGYYLYLPSTFIQHDLSFSDTSTYKILNEKYNNTPTYYQLMQSPKGGVIIRMYMGMSIILSPAFFIGHSIALLTGMPADGFSSPYQWSVIIFGLYFTLAGLLFARKLLLKYFNDGTTALTLIISYIGTNLFFFITLGNPIPHIYLFNLYIFLICFTIKWHEEQKWLNTFGIAISLGLILAIRPSELIAFFIPVLYMVYDQESVKEKITLIKRHIPQIISIAAIVFTLIFPQFLYWRLQGGEFLISVYTDPGSTMEWTNPKFINTLFSFRKGWFVYSPLTILAIIGIFVSFKKQKHIFLFTFLFIVFNIYIISCFTSLISYGYRAFLQSYALLLMPLALVVEFCLTKRRMLVVIFVAMVAGFTYLNIIQAYQLRMETIDKSRMTQSAYMAVLGKWNAPKPESLLSIERSGFGIDTLNKKELYGSYSLLFNNFEEKDESVIKHLDSILAFEGKYCLRMDSALTYSPGINIKIRDLKFEDHFWIKSSVEFYSTDSAAFTDGNLVVTVQKNDEAIKYRGINFEKQSLTFVSGKWHTLTFDFISPEFLPADAELKVYFWNSGKSTIYIDNLSVDFFSPK